jgi:hypothetical protein
MNCLLAVSLLVAVAIGKKTKTSIIIIKLLTKVLISFLKITIQFLKALFMFAVEGSYNYAPTYGKFGYVAAKIAAGSCPYGWSLYHGGCYYFSRDRLTWWQASVSTQCSPDFF